MNYTVLIANGDSLFNRHVAGVESFSVVDGVYYLYDKSITVLFSAPLDSVICISLD